MADWVDLAKIYLALDEEEMALLTLTSGMDNEKEETSYNPESRFNLNIYSDEECGSYFRFTKDEIKRLIKALNIPDPIKCQSVRATAQEAFCLLLRRLSYPNRLSDLLPMFGRSISSLSKIFMAMLEYIHSNFAHLLSDMNQPWLNRQQLQIFADAVHQKGAPLESCWGFVDGTACAIARPKVHQKVMYSGHKRFHCMKFQGIVTPNGLFANMFGPYEGRRHDAALWAESNILQYLEANMNKDDGTPFVLYGDAAYPLRNHLIKPFHGANRTAEQERFDSKMSNVRIAVEWAFGKLTTLFSFLTYERNMKVLLQPTGKMFMVGTLLTNLHTCLNGGVISDYFQVRPPSLENYINRQ